MSDFSHGGNPLHRGTLYLVSTTGDPEEPFFVEKLSSQVNLEMMLIPAGTFLMGSPENEIDRSSNESPQHSVNVPSFVWENIRSLKNNGG